MTFAQLALGMAAFGSATPVSKIVTQAMPVFVGSALRVGIGALALLPFIWTRRHNVRSISRGDWLRITIIALFGMFGFSALMLYGMRMVSGVTGAIVMSTAPAVTAAASMIFLKDAPTWRKFAAIALAVIGVGILNLGGSGGSGTDTGTMLLGIALVFAAVCCESVYTLVGKTASERVDPVVVAFLAAAMSLPLFVPLAIWQWSGFDLSGMDAGSWTAVIWYGAGTLALGSWLWYQGVAKAEGSVAAGFMGVMPASALLLSYVLLGDDFRLIHVAGFATVFAGVLLISWEHARMSAKD
ncbi:DMT family transporter [Hyphobacterium marinum]|uniref:DMT family transporter n=1 Tax=Hyphobacterium marinum TaxID=3116574 RepID=A0ABU7M144_9PROT|nr:DMT family transporter [Hyphobacterium sp. Y6023]MEE2567544.1 DMT family transporter [Hyphobacterium sp. Y6023]